MKHQFFGDYASKGFYCKLNNVSKALIFQSFFVRLQKYSNMFNKKLEV